MYRVSNPPGDCMPPWKICKVHLTDVACIQGGEISNQEDVMTQDPVCKMDVDERTAEFSAQYAGRKYYFCSEECKDDFEEHPEQYAATAA